MKSLLKWFKETFGNTWLVKEIGEFISSLDNSKTGKSGKKITIVVFVYCILRMHNEWLEFAHRQNDFSLFPIILGSDIGMVLSLFGINEYSKKKKEVPAPDQPTEESATPA